MKDTATKEIKEFLDYMQFVKKASPLTVKHYGPHLKEFFQLNNLHPQKVTKADCIAYISRMAQEPMVKKRDGKEAVRMCRTIQNKCHTISSFFNYMVLMDKMDKNPFFKLPLPNDKSDRKKKVFMTEAECLAMLDLPQNTRQDRMDKLVLEFLYSSGGRRADAWGSRLADLNLEAGTLHVVGKGRKPADLGINASCKRALESYLATDRPVSDDPHLLLREDGKPYTGNIIYNTVARCAKKAGVNKKVSPHAWRRSLATHLKNRGVDLDTVRQLLRHESLSVTQQYLEENSAEVRSKVMTAHPRQ